MVDGAVVRESDVRAGVEFNHTARTVGDECHIGRGLPGDDDAHFQVVHVPLGRGFHIGYVNGGVFEFHGGILWEMG